MSPLFVDREREVKKLQELIALDGQSLALVYGRRRVGKTYLLTHAWSDMDVERFYFTASATTPELNRQALLREASAWSGEELRFQDYPTWRMLFRALFELCRDRPLVVVLDEFQYLGADESGLREVASELNAVWERPFTRNAGLLVVLSGSAVHSLRALESGGSPLFGRLDWRAKLSPFDYFDAAQMVSYDVRDQVLTYAAFGGIPKYLDAIDDTKPLSQNIIDLILSADGPVRMQVETALEQEEGLRDFGKYRAILTSIGLSRRTVGDIAAALGQSLDSGLKRMVKELVRLEFLEEEKNFDAPRNQAKRYRIQDPAQRFYYGLVLPNESAIASAGPEKVWTQRIEPQVWPTYVGKEVFEDVVHQAYLRKSGTQDLISLSSWGNWEGQDRHRELIEIDLVARLLDDSLMTGSVKFRNRLAGARVFHSHLDALKRLGESGQSWSRDAQQPGSTLLFVSAEGFKDSFHEICLEYPDYKIITWELADLFDVSRGDTIRGQAGEASS